MIVTLGFLASSSAFASYAYQCTVQEKINNQSTAPIDQKSDVIVYHAPFLSEPYVKVYLDGKNSSSGFKKLYKSQFRASASNPEQVKVSNFFGTSVYTLDKNIFSGPSSTHISLNVDDVNPLGLGNPRDTYYHYELECTRQ